jgi:hypothetical protein
MQLKQFKKYVLLSFLFSQLYSIVSAEGNLPYIDNKLIHFGFSLGVNEMDFGINSTQDSIGGKLYHSDVSTLKPGFSVGIISDLRLNRYLNLRFTPTLHFGERELTYKAIGDSVTTSISITSIPISLPLYFKYSSERKGNYRPYLIWGAGISIDLGRNKENPVLLQPIDFYTEFGVGCDLYFSFFKLAPELKFALGFNNMFTPLDVRDAGQISNENQKYSLALTKLTSRMLTLTFNFE